VIKRSCASILALALMLAAAAMAILSVSGASYFPKIVFLGDSITTGYGLSGEKSSPDSYANRLASYLRSDTVVNHAVNGDDSTDMYNRRATYLPDVRTADLIVVTIGGNDLLDLVWDAAEQVLPGTRNDPSKLTVILNDSAMRAQMESKLTLSTITRKLAIYQKNVKSIAEMLRKSNAKAPILFLAQYDPFSGTSGYDSIASKTNEGITMMNNMMKQKVQNAGCTYIDVYTPFVGKGPTWTNVAQLDIHPNKEGHKQIFNVIKKHVDQLTASMPPLPTDPVTIAPVTTAPVTTAPVTTAPVTTAPVTTAPVTTAPVTTAPVTTAPVTTAPVTTAPVTTAPVTTVPDTTVPVTTVPDTTVPVTTVPVTTAPVTTAPDTTVPDTTVPDTTIPDTTVPESTTPGTTAPGTKPVTTDAPSTKPVTTAPTAPSPDDGTTSGEGTSPSSTDPIGSAPDATVPAASVPSATKPGESPTSGASSTEPSASAPSSEQESGCGSTLVSPIIGLILAIGAGAVIEKKKLLR